ncbi:MAG: hypothetical protein K8T20_11730 [Planctomycetes bacterium]|nr:hypothetical protein [Planctomycetota bacterium]
MNRMMASGMALVFALSLGVAAQEPPKPETKDPKKSTAADPEALKAVQKGVAQSMKKKYNFKGAMDVEVGGSPMMSIQMTGEHAGKWMHVKTEIMGNPVEAYSDGTTSISKDPRSGEWKKQDGAAGSGVRGGLGMEQVAKAVKSARFDGEAKVGTHACKVIRAKADVDALRKAMGGGRGAAQGKVTKSSLKFYVDKKDGRLRRIKLTMDAEGDMGGQKMQFKIISSYRYTYRKDVKVELPAEVKALLEEKPQAPPDKKDEPMDEGGNKEEGSGGKK